MKGRISIIAALALTACAGTPPVPCGTTQGTCPMQAIERAAAAAPYGVRGRYALVVRSSGRERGLEYLDSQRDYRDQRNVAVVLYPHAQAQLRARFGGDPGKVLMGHRIAVIGVARRSKVHFLDGSGRDSGSYYYQTHIAVVRGRQLLDLGGRARGPISPMPPARPVPTD